MTGRLIYTDDKPVVGAHVSAIGGALESWTNDTGRFRLTEVPSEGSVTLTVVINEIIMHISGVNVQESGEIDIGETILQAGVVPGDIRIIPSIILATTTDTNVLLLVEAVISDSLIKILQYEWDIDNNSAWDTITPTGRLRIPVPSVGTNTVKVHCMSTDSIYSDVADLHVKVSQANNPARFTISAVDMDSTALVDQLYTDTVHAVDDDGDSIFFFFRR